MSAPASEARCAELRNASIVGRKKMMKYAAKLFVQAQLFVEMFKEDPEHDREGLEFAQRVVQAFGPRGTLLPRDDA